MNSRTKKLSYGSVTVLVGALAFASISQSRTARADGPPPLPPEAYTPCESKASGDACVATIRGKDLDGTCVPDREGSKLFCRPTAMPPPPDGR